MSKKILIPCRIKKCDHAPFISVVAERMHYHRVHSGHMSSSSGHARNGSVQQPSKVDRWTKAWRQANPKSSRRMAEAGQDAKFCPCCGFNLSVLNLALKLAVKYQHEHATHEHPTH